MWKKEKRRNLYRVDCIPAWDRTSYGCCVLCWGRLTYLFFFFVLLPFALDPSPSFSIFLYLFLFSTPLSPTASHSSVPFPHHRQFLSISLSLSLSCALYLCFSSSSARSRTPCPRRNASSFYRKTEGWEGSRGRQQVDTRFNDNTIIFVSTRTCLTFP